MKPVSSISVILTNVLIFIGYLKMINSLNRPMKLLQYSSTYMGISIKLSK